METKELKVSKVVFREDLYPRMETNPTLVQTYAEIIEVLPPIEVNQHSQLPRPEGRSFLGKRGKCLR